MTALIDKRARIDGEILNRRFQIMRLEVERANLDAVIKMFRPGYDVNGILPKRSFSKNPAGTRRGAGSREALTVLREAGEPLTASEIAGRVLTRLGKAVTPESRGMLANTIFSTFTRRRDGAVIYDASTHPGRWSLSAWRVSAHGLDSGPESI
ncbi:hypothetical protein [Sphingomonas bacterium]|uniref:hypothetical protein n=1 Tax=Sphingomonas bacterium TaxID=1895847 RepID=UPI0026359252|nr:hypothetical protein [Sphingomonas bacterium]